MNAMAKLSMTATRQMPGLSSLIVQLVSLAALKQAMEGTQRVQQEKAAAYHVALSLFARLACRAFAAIGKVGFGGTIGNNVGTAARNRAGHPETLGISGADWKYAGIIRGGTP